mgnify:CR=1 FL=1
MEPPLDKLGTVGWKNNTVDEILREPGVTTRNRFQRGKPPLP